MHRKLLPLALMYAGEEASIEGRTRLQKMVFLMQQRFKERGESPLRSQPFEFIAYDYGPFSKDLYSELETLIERDEINDRKETTGGGSIKYTYSIKPQGREIVEAQLSTPQGQEIVELAQEIKEEYNEMFLSDLIEKVYSQYPSYAENSIY